MRFESRVARVLHEERQSDGGREGERLFNWNGQPKPFFLVTHYGKSKSETWVRRRARF